MRVEALAAAAASLVMAHAPSFAQGTVFKCTAADGKIVYQDSRCGSGATQNEVDVTPPTKSAPADKAPANAGTAPNASARDTAAKKPAATDAATREAPTSAKKAAKEIEPMGPRETWDRFVDVLKGGDKAAPAKQAPGDKAVQTPADKATQMPADKAPAKQ